MQLLFFLALASVAIAGALGVVLSKKPVYSALSLLVNFAVVAVLFITLHAQFVAVVQIIVYAGAIVVLFLFVIMLIGGDLGRSQRAAAGARSWPDVAVVAGVLLLAGPGLRGRGGPDGACQATFPARAASRPLASAVHRLPAALRADFRTAAGGYDRRGRAGAQAGKGGQSVIVRLDDWVTAHPITAIT